MHNEFEYFLYIGEEESGDEMGFDLFGSDDEGPSIVHRKVLGSPPKSLVSDDNLNVCMYLYVLCM